MRNGFAFLIGAAGFGLCCYAALQWFELPTYSEHDIAASVELNLAVDRSRQNADAKPDANQTDLQRQEVRKEIEADIAGQRQWPLQWLRSGIVLIVVALLMAWPSLPKSWRRKSS